MRSDMEKTRRWMWAAARTTLNEKLAHGRSQIPGSLYAYESWEEKAFAEDSAGHLGGCVWPPRSYPCSFCKREFRSAQALGGHMNVHRRDRARLKQSLNPTPTSASAATADDDDDDDIAGAALDPPMIRASRSRSKLRPSSAPAPDISPRVSVASAAARRYALLSPPHKASVLLGFVPADHEEEEEEEGIGIKRRRRTDQINFSTTSSSSSGTIREKEQSDQVLKQSPWPVEELDLELRLGQKRKPPVMVEL